MSKPTTVAEFLRAARESRGLTQEELAARAGIKQSRISVLESGKGVVRLGDLAVLQPHLRMDLDRLAALPRGAA